MPMNAMDIPVVLEEKIETYRQVVRPRTQEEVGDILLALHRVLRLGKFTGDVVIRLNQGGVREIVSQQVASGPSKLTARSLPVT